MFENNIDSEFVNAEQCEFDFYLQWEWPEHIETAIRRLLWISLVEAAESSETQERHTSLVRWMIATHPESPAEALEYIASLGDPRLLERVAENPQTSSATLARLAKSDCSAVRIALSDNRRTPINILLELAADTDADVRYCMAENPALPAKILTRLQEDENVYVKARAKATLQRRNPTQIISLNVDEQRRAM